MLTQEREREKQDRERRRLEKEETMDVDGVPPPVPSGTLFEEDTPTCKSEYLWGLWLVPLLMMAQTRPSKHPLRCSRRGSIATLPASRHVFSPRAILAHAETKVKANYTDPATGLRYYDKNVYQVIKGLVGFQTAHVIMITLTHDVLEHGCSARLPGGTWCEPYREVASNRSRDVCGTVSVKE